MAKLFSSGVTAKIREYGIVILILTAAILLFWWRVWIPSLSDRMHFTDDVLVKDYPTRMGLFRQVVEGRLPLWDPYQFGGWPGLANCEAGVFYPLNWVLIPFSHSPQMAFQGTQWLVLFHLMLAGLGGYRYARFIGLTPLGAGFTAMAFTFCGFFCAHKKHTNMIFALVWFPWLLLQAERWIRENHTRFLFRLTVLLALAYLAGHPQSSLYITFLLVARLVCGIFERPDPFPRSMPQKIFRGIFPAFGVLILAGSLAAIQYVPTVELIQQSERSDAGVFQRSSEFSMPPTELLEAFLPGTMSFWTQTEVFYWGLIPLLLAIHFIMRGGMKPLDRYLLGVGILSILLSFGEYLFVYDLSYLLIPGAAWVRAPSRWIFFAGLPIALAAGREIDFYLQDHSSPSQRSLHPFYWKIVGAIAVFATLLVGCVAFTVEYSLPPESRLAGWQELLRSYMSMLFFGGVFLLLFQGVSKKQVRPVVFAVSVIVIGWIDLGTHFRTFDLAPGVGGHAVDSEMEWLHQSAWNQRTKVLFKAGGDRTLYHGAAQNFYEVDGQSPLTPRIHLDIREDTNIPFPDKPNLNLFRLLGIRTVLTDIKGLSSPFQRETDRLYTLDSPLPRAYALRDWMVADPTTQRALLQLQSFPFDRVALVEEDALDALTGNSGNPSLEGALFPKPFLLASCSVNAVRANAFLIVEGKNYFDEEADRKAGYYVAVGDARTGKIEKTESFDLMESITHDNDSTQQRMREFMQSIPEGKTVFVAVKDNAADSLLPIGLSALREIGASLDARGKFRLAHAIVGRKGAPIGSAVELFSATEAMILQTDKSISIQGIVVPKPEPRWLATVEHADKWYSMLTEINRDKPSPLLYDVSDETRGSTDPLRVSVPIMIFSAPKKMVSYTTRDWASMTIANREYAFNRRGYNLAVVDPKTFEVIRRDCFDLFLDYDADAIPSLIKADAPENYRMQQFLQSVPMGYLILGAIRDDATDLMIPGTLEALKEIGSSLYFDRNNPDARKRIAHAFIAIQGAKRCIEAFGQDTDAIVFTRYPGGPALSHYELKSQAGLFLPVNPVDEMVDTLEEKATLSGGRPSKRKPKLPVWAVVEDEINRLRLSGQSDTEALVFISEIFYPGWEAYVDGVLQPIRRMNYYFRGVQVSPGRHEIELVYVPPSFRLGATISLIGLIVLIGWWIALLVMNPVSSRRSSKG